MTILVTGARGAIARSLIEQLLTAGHKVRAAGREPAAARLPAGVDVMEADLARPETLGAALAGATKVFVYAEPTGLDGFVAEARAAGVEHIVLLSALGAEPGAADRIPRIHGDAEQAVAGSGIPWTFLRPGGFATNALQWAGSVRAEGTVCDPFPESHAAPVHEADIAAVAARVLTDPGTEHLGAVHVLTGPGSLTRREQAEQIGAAIGRPVRIVRQSLDDHRAELAQWGPPDVAEALIRTAEEAVGRPAETTGTVQEITGRPPRSFAEWAADHAADFTAPES
ncbi:NAD(P)H-binding protein [Spirillospora sp. NBC_01491]|uniref:NAD(P)H-binding protein n=1 Tax=Spirillospora sp. NBC_01491 TaxID=2976007 RepID=UPI002E332CC7|nr:NAD(P)H-binding protein [Spirillospora sp. NBC_01491]